MGFECDSDSSTDMGDESEPDPEPEPDTDTDLDLDDAQARQHLEPEPDAPTNEYTENQTPIEQLEARTYREHLAKLHVDIKAWAQIPTKPVYQKLYCTWPPRPFTVRSLKSSFSSSKVGIICFVKGWPKRSVF
jgi:hypothetical protein